MLYPKNQAETLSPELFANPTSEYRGAPFWAWNGVLDKERLSEEIDIFRQMGFGGFHMHVRTGLDTPYLSPEYMDFVRFCTDKAKQNSMLAWLYDEDRWPSGSAGGRVTAEHPEYAAKMLLFTPRPYTPERPHLPKGPVAGMGSASVRHDNGVLLGVWDIRLDHDGCLAEAVRQASEASAGPAEGFTRWYAYLESATDDPWYNNHPYVDTLNPNAIRAFLETTHEAYRKALEADFGKTVPAIFTDEPQFVHKGCLSRPSAQEDVMIPWTDNLEQLYEKAYGQSLPGDLPQLFWELPQGRIAPTRWRYQNLLAGRFAEGYCGQIGSWCRKNGIALSGHVNGEERLDTQASNVGDAMRCYPEFGIPGIDILCDFHEYNTLRQCQSIVRQQGKESMISELYGVTGWDYDFRGYKLQGDWQAAMGVTVRVPHLTWMTMKGEAKRDYPASIGHQSPWWDQFSLIENHFARLNTALTRGKPEVKVAVIHPIESYWLLWGPSLQTAARRDQMEQRFASVTETLLFGLVDFDFLCEARLPEQCPAGGAPLRVGRMAYDTVLVPGCITLRPSTLERLKAFREGGGRLIFLGDCPTLANGLPAPEIKELYDLSLHLDFDPAALLEALEPDRFVSATYASGQRTDSLIYQLRRDGDRFWLFLANGRNPESPDVDPAPRYSFDLKGTYTLTEYNTLDGSIAPLPARHENGHTRFERVWHIHDSLLLLLTPVSEKSGSSDRIEAPESTVADLKDPDVRETVGADFWHGLTPKQLMTPVQVTPEEPNMLLLDLGEWALDDGPWQPTEELLRLDNQARQLLGIPLRKKAVVQPYLLEKEQPEHLLHLRFVIPSRCEITAPKLALEDAEHTRLIWNGTEVPMKPDGWFVDRDIVTVPLPPLVPGENILEATVPLGRRTNPEPFYLLGAFNVQITGTVKTVLPATETLGFGDIVPQGLPFYTGNLQYHFDTETTGGDLLLRVPHYRGSLIRVLADGCDRGSIVFSPYALRISGLAAGRHRITLRLFGNRQNGFGQLHHTPGIYFYQSPDSWRSKDDLWRYEYSMKELGILRSPEWAEVPREER